MFRLAGKLVNKNKGTRVNTDIKNKGKWVRWLSRYRHLSRSLKIEF